MIVTALLLAACSPRLDWREIPNPEAGYLALFPARPAKATRPVSSGSQTLELTLQAATAGNTTFAVGSAELPAGLTQMQWLALFETALLNNLQAQAAEPVPQASDAVRDIVARGTLRSRPQDTQGTPAQLRARFYLRERRLYEVVVIAPQAEWDEEAVETFLAGFKIQGAGGAPSVK